MSEFRTQISGGQAKDDELASFEKFLHAPLPEDYRAFLRQYNGCIPAPATDTYTVKIDLPGGNEITVEQFYSLSEQSPLLSLYRELEDYAEIVPVTTVPIGHDSFGNMIGLDWESGEVNWTFCQHGYDLHLYQNFDLGVSFAEFVRQLGPGPYVREDEVAGVKKAEGSIGWWGRVKAIFR